MHWQPVTRTRAGLTACWIVAFFIAVNIAFQMLNARSTPLAFLGLAVLGVALLLVPGFVYQIWRVVPQSNPANKPSDPTKN